MRFDTRSSSFQLLKLAIGSAKFSPRRALTNLSLILLFAAGSLYITNHIYQGKLLSLVTDKTESTKGVKPSEKAKKQPALLPQSYYISPEIKELRQKRKQEAIKRSKFRLETSSLSNFKRDVHQKTKPLPRRKMLWTEQAREKLARHQSNLSQADEESKLQLQDQQLYSEKDTYPPPLEDEEAPPPPEQKPGFWGELGTEIIGVLKELLKKII